MIQIDDIVIKPTVFPDGTSQVWHLPPGLLSLSSEECGALVVSWRFESEAEVMHLAQLKALLDAADIPGHLSIRTLPYARQDKPIGNEATFALHVFADMLNAMGWQRVLLHDPHSPVALERIQRSIAAYYDSEARLAFRACGANLLCFPDRGATTKYAPMFQGLGAVTASKVRDQATGAITGVQLDEPVHGARVLIVDDICDGGATFIGVARELFESGAESVFLFVSHGIFSKGLKPLLDAGISRIFVPEKEVTP